MHIQPALTARRDIAAKICKLFEQSGEDRRWKRSERPCLESGTFAIGGALGAFLLQECASLSGGMEGWRDGGMLR